MILKDITILNTRPLPLALELTQAIEKNGGRCVMLPSLQIMPLFNDIQEKVSQSFQESDIVLFTSQYAVDLALQTSVQYNGLIGAVGRATAAAIKKKGLFVTLIPQEASTEGLLNLPELQKICLKGKKITLFCGRGGRALLYETLIERGAMVNKVMLYERTLPTWTEAEYANLIKTPIHLALGLSVDSIVYFFSCLKPKEKIRFSNLPWLVMSSRVALQAKTMGIKTIHKVGHQTVLEAIEKLVQSQVLMPM